MSAKYAEIVLYLNSEVVRNLKYMALISRTTQRLVRYISYTRINMVSG